MKRAVQIALLLERYGLSLVFFWFTWKQLVPVRTHAAAWLGGSESAFASFVNHSLVLVLQFAAGLVLLINRQPQRLPDSWKEIVVPIIGTFFFVSYNFADRFPAALARPLVPEDWRAPLAGIAIVLSTIGFAIAVWGVIALGRSFAVLVAVREIVSTGPYRLVRHPIYSGYVLPLIGLNLSSSSIAMLLLTTAHFAVTVWRARLEEASLSAHSEAYRRYAATTGMLFPRWR